MLAIRMQRVGRTGHAQFRMIVQDSHFHPTSGRVVAYLGSYNPHTKTINFDKDKIEAYLANGAQPSPRVIKLLKNEKITLPKWVSEPAKKEKSTRNPDKRRSTRPVEEQAAETQAEQPSDTTEPEAEATVEEKPASDEQESSTEETNSAEESQAEKPAEPAAEEAPAEAAPEPSEPEQPPAEENDQKPSQ